MTKPRVIVRTDYMLSLNNPDRMKSFKDKDIKYVDGLLDYFSDEKKRALNLVDYFTGKINKKDDINLILENGKAATEEEKQRRKKYINKQFHNSNIWQIVLSLDENFVDKNISWEDLEVNLAKEILPKVFKKMGFIDSGKICFQFSRHMNTKNPHIHIAFMEKCPNTLNKDGSVGYKRKGKISQNVIKFLKQETCLSIERNSKFKPMAININKDIDEFKKYFTPNSHNFVLKDKSNILLEEKILTLGKLLYDKEIGLKGKIKFNSIKDEVIKTLTNEIKKELFKNSNDLEISKKEFNNSIKMLNDYILELGRGNKIKKSNLNFSYTKNKEKYLDNYILNAIVNYSKYNYDVELSKIKIKGDNIIQTIILNNYKKNKNYSKKDIIHTSLATKSGKLYNTKEIQRAVKNINDEMEQASSEFHKLFIQEKDYNN